MCSGFGESEEPNLMASLQRDFPNLRWRGGRKFMFRPPRTIVVELSKNMKAQGRLTVGQKTVSAVSSGLGPMNTKNQLMNTDCAQDEHLPWLREQNLWNMQLLHEVGHALLGHRNYVTDIERVKMERAAWEKAEELYIMYSEELMGDGAGVEVFTLGFDREFVEVEMDSYRDWLHQRSKCLECGLTRYQTIDGAYHCPQCEQKLYF